MWLGARPSLALNVNFEINSEFKIISDSCCHILDELQSREKKLSQVGTNGIPKVQTSSRAAEDNKDLISHTVCLFKGTLLSFDLK